MFDSNSHTCLLRYRQPKDLHHTHKGCFYTLIGCCSRLSHLPIKVGLTDSLVLFQWPRFVLFLCCLKKFSGVMANNALFFYFLKAIFSSVMFCSLVFHFCNALSAHLKFYIRVIFIYTFFCLLLCTVMCI